MDGLLILKLAALGVLGLAAVVGWIVMVVRATVRRIRVRKPRYRVVDERCTCGYAGDCPIHGKQK
jgi:hypothetical protein